MGIDDNGPEEWVVDTNNQNVRLYCDNRKIVLLKKNIFMASPL